MNARPHDKLPLDGDAVQTVNDALNALLDLAEEKNTTLTTLMTDNGETVGVVLVVPSGVLGGAQQIGHFMMLVQMALELTGGVLRDSEPQAQA